MVKRQEKAIVWTIYPFEQLLVASLLVLVHITGEAYLSELNPIQRHALQGKFNSPTDKCTVLVCNYSVNGVGLNLQHQCRNVHLFDPAISKEAQEQAVGRCYRIG